MTFSIVAFDRRRESWGVAVASKCLAVGHAVPWGGAEPARSRPRRWPTCRTARDGLELLRAGTRGARLVARLVADDPLPTQRQLGVVDAHGRAANHTGEPVHRLGGRHRRRRDARCRATSSPGRRWSSACSRPTGGRREPFVRRLLRALEAGDAPAATGAGSESAAVRDLAGGRGLRRRPRHRRSTCASTTTRSRSPSSAGCSTRTTCTSAGPSPARCSRSTGTLDRRGRRRPGRRSATTPSDSQLRGRRSPAGRG